MSILSLFSRWFPLPRFASTDWSEQVRDLEHKATAAKKNAPDQAIGYIRQALRIAESNGLHPHSLLNMRLRIVTILYESGRLGEALEALQGEYSSARAMYLSDADIKAADRMHRERIRELKYMARKFGDKYQPYELRRDGGEWPDFERNLYCKSIYAKLRVCHTKAKSYLDAAKWACADAYAQYENETQSMYSDDCSIDFSTTQKLLDKAKRSDLLPRFREIAAKYSKDPICERCWAMIDEMDAILR